MLRQIEFSDKFYDDIGEITDYLSIPSALSKFRTALVRVLGNIRTSPFIGTVYKRKYRKIVFIYAYAVFYTVDEKSGVITVLRILDTRRNVDNIVF